MYAYILSGETPVNAEGKDRCERRADIERRRAVPRVRRDSAVAEETLDRTRAAAARKILSDSQADFVNLLPNQELMKYLDKVEAVPTTIFVDEEGNIIGEQVVGANVPKYKELLARYLK